MGETQSTTNQQQQNHRLRTDSSQSRLGLKCILLEIFALDSDVVAAQKC